MFTYLKREHRPPLCHSFFNSLFIIFLHSHISFLYMLWIERNCPYLCLMALLMYVLCFVVHHSWLCHLIYFVLLLALCASFNSSQLNPRFKNVLYTFTSKFFVHLDLKIFYNFKLICFKLLCTWNLWCVRWVHIFENKSTSIVVWLFVIVYVLLFQDDLSLSNTLWSVVHFFNVCLDFLIEV